MGSLGEEFRSHSAKPFLCVLRSMVVAGPSPLAFVLVVGSFWSQVLSSSAYVEAIVHCFRGGWCSTFVAHDWSSSTSFAALALHKLAVGSLQFPVFFIHNHVPHSLVRLSLQMERW